MQLLSFKTFLLQSLVDLFSKSSLEICLMQLLVGVGVLDHVGPLLHQVSQYPAWDDLHPRHYVLTNDLSCHSPWSLVSGLWQTCSPTPYPWMLAFQWGCTAGVGESILSDTVVRLTVDVAVVKVLDPGCLQFVGSLLDLELSASPILGLEIWLIWSLSSLWTPLLSSLPGWCQE